MKYLLLFIFSLTSYIAIAQQPEPVAGNQLVCSNIDQMIACKGNAVTAMVTDKKRGGLFYYTTEKQSVDNGTVYAGYNKGYWVRMYDEAVGVHVSWFTPKEVVDSNNTYDKATLIKIFSYPKVIIDVNTMINDIITIAEGNTLVFSGKSMLSVSAKHILTLNATIVAGDYQNILGGEGQVLLGAKSAPYASACWFGAIADCQSFGLGKGHDNTLAIQKAINASYMVSDLYLPPSPANMSYRITKTITLKKNLHFFSFNFHGGGTSITANRDDRATTIFADFTDSVAINVQGCRRVYMRNFVLEGRNIQSKELGTWAPSIAITPALDSPNSFTAPDVKPTYVGIATDAEKGSKTWSADVIFDNLLIQRFYLGISISAAGNYQGDRMRVENTQINHCTYGISIGNAQNRACHFLNVDMDFVWCAYTNCMFGSGTGSEFQITGGQICNAYKLFNIQPYNLGQCVVSGLYTEGIGCIGYIGSTNSSTNSMLFTGCEFFMQDAGLFGSRAFYSKFYTLTTCGNVSFVGCNFWTAKPYIAFYASNLNSRHASCITFSGCAFYKSQTLHVFGNATIDNSYMITSYKDVDYNTDIRGDIEIPTRYTTTARCKSFTSLFDNEYDKTGKKGSFNRSIVRTMPRFYKVCEGTNNITDFTNNKDTITFHYNQFLYDSLFKYVLQDEVLGTTMKGFDTWDNPTMWIMEHDTAARTIKAFMKTDQFTLDNIAIYVNNFFTTVPVTGNIAYGSNKVTDVTNIKLLRYADFITFKGSENMYRIRIIDTTANTLTLVQNIQENTNGTVTFYNQLLIDQAKDQ